LKIASELCIYTNNNINIYTLDNKDENKWIWHQKR
jgi:hypothetical protein